MILHPVDIIRRKRDGQELAQEEITFMVTGAARETIPPEQLSAWLMACFLCGLSDKEIAALTFAMRDSGEKRERNPRIAPAVDKHSTGGVGDKTSFLVAPIAAAAGVYVPMISGRALGHTGGTLDKLESIPGYRTQLSLKEMQHVLEQTGASIVGQTKNLVPADRVLYMLRDATGTVESPALICASIMSKKLAASLDGLVLDVKYGSGAFLKDPDQAKYLASLMVRTGNSAGTNTVALLTSMDQPLGRFAGNWIEIQEAVELLAGKRHPLSEDLRELSLELAGWMIHLGGVAEDARAGRFLAEQLLDSGAALERFRAMVEAQDGDVLWVDDASERHQPRVTTVLRAHHDGYIQEIDCEALGWAVQRLGAGRIRPGDAVSPMAGFEMHAKLGSRVEKGQPLYTLFADTRDRFQEPEQLLRDATTVASEPPGPRPLIREVIR